MLIKKLLILFLFLTTLYSASVDKMVGEVGELEEVEETETQEAQFSISGSCDCSDIIESKADNIKESIDDYIDTNLETFQNLRSQVVENKHELSNRTNQIEDDNYYDSMKDRFKKITNQNSRDINKYKLLAYRNLLHFSQNGEIDKESNFLQIYSLLTEIEQIQTSLKILKKD